MRIFLFLFCFFIYINIWSQSNNDLTIVVKGYKSLNGNILIAVYNKKENYMKVESAYLLGIIKPVKEKTNYTFKNVPGGEYAISIFHDEDNNGKLGTYLFGIPSERNGFSNNVRGLFGPPTFKDAKFRHDTNQEIVISVQ